MQKNIHTTGKKSPYKYSKSRYSSNKNSGGNESSNDRHFSRKMSRADSGIEGSVVLSRSDSETETPMGPNDVCHSPTEGDVFSFSQEGDQGGNKAVNYAKSLSSRIPKAKLAKQMSKLSNNKDR